MLRQFDLARLRESIVPIRTVEFLKDCRLLRHQLRM